MHDENLHITPDPKKGFPQPDIPADEAWNKMAGLLDNGMPTSPSDQASPSKPPAAPSGGGILGTNWNFWGIIVGVVAIVGVLTWGIVNLTNKPQTSAVVHETIKSAQNITVTDSSTLTHNNETIQSEKVASAETIVKQGNKTSLPEAESVGKKNVQPAVNSGQGIVSQPGAVSEGAVVGKPINNAKTDEVPAVAVVVVALPGQAAMKLTTIEPAQAGPGNVTTSVRDIPVKQPVNGTILKDSLQLAKSQPQPLPTDTASSQPSDKPVSGGNVPFNPSANMNPDETLKTSGPDKSKKSKGMSGNLSWQMDVNGNIGQVHQKGRDPNMFYGAMVTAGLCNKKLKGGIETGLGWEDYQDYGSVTNNIRITDSIPVDTLGNWQYVDTTRITAYKYRYRYLQIPLFVSKQLVSAGNFSFGLKTGPLIGIMISDQKTLNYATGPEGGEILSTVNNNYSRLKISWQWQVMLQFRWNFNDRLSLTLSPYGIFYLNNLYNSKNRPANMPFGIGLNGGLIYRFK